MKFKISLAVLLVMGVLLSTVTFARSHFDTFVLVNRTGRDIKAIHISPTAADEWERYYAPYGEIIYDGESAEIDFDGDSRNRFWDLRCTFTNGRTEIYDGVEIYDGARITVRRNGDFSVR